MEKQRRSRYLIAIYLVVVLGAVVLILVGVYSTKDPVWQSVYINVATGLLGVALLFFLVDRFFLADEWRLSDRVDLLVRQLELSEQPSAEEFFTKQPDLAKYIRTAKTIRMCGVSLTSTLNRQFGHLRERLAQGATVDLLVSDPDSLALKMSALRSENPDDIEYYSKRLESAFKDISYLHESCQNTQSGSSATTAGSLSVHMLGYAPSFSMYQFEGQDGKKIMFVEMYTHGTGYITPPLFELTPERDHAWYDYFVRQFDYMWQRATPWSPALLGEYSLQNENNRRRRLVSAEDFFTRHRHVPDHLLENAKAILISGFTLSRTTREYLRQLDHCLATDGEVRIMILDSGENLLEECTRRSHGRTTAAHWRKRLESTVSLVEVLGNAPDITGSIELGRLPYLPSFGFIMVDPDTEHGVIVVEIYHHRSAEDNPTFELYADRDQEWYRFFRQQFETMWESCHIEEFAIVSET